MRATLLLALLVAACAAPRPQVARERKAIRPTDGTGWHNNGYGDVLVEHWDTPSGHFRIHFTREGKNAVPLAGAGPSEVPPFVTAFGVIFDEVYAGEVQAFGFSPPLSDAQYHDRPDYGGDGRFDVYLLDQNGSSDGYAVTEACTPAPPVRCAGYMVVENDFVGYPYPTPQAAMQTLASHEFFHRVQAAYRDEIDHNFSEGTAVWATEQVYPELGDLEGFLPAFFDAPERSLDHTLGTPADGFPYGTAIWPTYLAERFGPAMLVATFEELGANTGAESALDAVDRVLQRDHASSLTAAFAEFALWNYFTGSRAGGFASYAGAASYPEVALQGVSGALPLRIEGEIAYLATRYYRLDVPAGTRLRLASERPQPQLVLHAVSWRGSQAEVVTAMPGEPFVELTAPGAIDIVAASTARADRFLPLSIAVTELPPAPQPDAGVADDAGPGDDAGATTPPPSDDGGGCSAAPGAARGPWALLGLLLGLLALRARPWRAAALRALALGGALVLVAACSDGGGAADAGADGAAADGSAPAPDLAADAAPQPDGPAFIAPGTFVDFDADGEGVIRGALPATPDQRYLLLLLSRSTAALSELPYTLLAAEPPAAMWPAPAGAAPPAPAARRCDFASRLRRLLAAVDGPLLTPPRRYTADPTPPQVGDQRTFLVESATATTTITAEALAVDDVAAFWIDRSTEPLASIDPAALAELAAGFSQTVVPRLRTYFGTESDVDGDGLISVLLSPLVAASAVAYVRPCDLLDPAAVSFCSTSNQMELLYLSPPSSLPGPYNTPAALLETIAHELQHAIYFYRKFVRNDLVGAVENPYLTEGLSHLAQDLSGYQAGNLYVVMATLDHPEALSATHVFSDAIPKYLPKPYDGYMRGGGYLLLRYLFDRAGGDAIAADGRPQDRGGIAWLRGFVDSAKTAAPNVLASAGLSHEQLLEDFWTALALSNRGPDHGPLSSDPRYGYLPTSADPVTGRQRGCNLFAAFHGMQMVGPATLPLAEADGSLLAGGAELLRLAAAAGETSVRFAIKTDPRAAARGRLMRLE